jgi:N-carbamoylputrescine amidase
VIRVSVCELPDNRANFELAWSSLVQHVQFVESDLVVLPEMPASAWFGYRNSFDQTVWDSIVADHDLLVRNLGEFGAATVVGSRAATVDGQRRNIAFVWTRDGGLIDLHAKAILPEEPGFREQTWYAAGPFDHKVTSVGPVELGVLLCSELMSTNIARELGQAGAHFIACPRATGDHQRWQIASQMAATSSGAFVLTSNRSGQGQDGKLQFGGRGMIVDPDGTILAQTSGERPFATTSIDLETAASAKTTYPRYLAYSNLRTTE